MSMWAHSKHRFWQQTMTQKHPHAQMAFMNTPVQVSPVWFLQIERNGCFSVQRGAPRPKKKCAHRAHQKSTNDSAWNLEPWHSSLQLFFFLPKTPSPQHRVVESTCQSAWQSTKGYLSLFFGLD